MITGELKSRIDRIWDSMWSGGYSLDDKRSPQPDRTDLPDILARWRNRTAEAERPRTAQCFMAPREEIAQNDYDLSINRYKEVEYDAIEYNPPADILARLAALDTEIALGRAELEEMLRDYPFVRGLHREARRPTKSPSPLMERETTVA